MNRLIYLGYSRALKILNRNISTYNFDEITSDWEVALEKSVVNSIFMTPLWQKIWCNQFVEKSNLKILRLPLNADLGIAPLMIKNGTISLIGSTDLFDYRDFVVPRGLEKEFYIAILDQINLFDWKSIKLSSIREDSPTLNTFASIAKNNMGYDIQILEEDVSPGMNLPNDWEEFISNLPKKDRHELRRKIRRLERYGEVGFQVLTNSADVKINISDFFSLMKKSRLDKAEFLTDERESFFRTISTELSNINQLRLYFLELNGIRVAATLGFEYNNNFYLYNSGYDPEYSSLSVGLISKAYCIKDAIENEMTYFDFLRGSESYKYHLGGKDKLLYEMIINR